MAKGRPRGFDADEALDKAINIFWRQGYEGASLPDLTRAMGINRPSMYAAFGNKESLYRQAMSRYVEKAVASMRAALEEPTARGAAKRLLLGTIDLLTNPKTPSGCLLVKGTLACGEERAPARVEVLKQRAATEKKIVDRFKRAVREGDLPRTVNPASLARFITTVMAGLSVQASAGAGRRELILIAETAMLAWPPDK